MAALDDSGELADGAALDHFSIVDSHFLAFVASREPSGVVVGVRGSAYLVAECTFTLDQRDRLGLGFVLR
ncbi:hypothetical protein [Arthrobacter psychrolactophilus]